MDKAKIGPKEAADTIREDFHNEHADPRFLHQVKFSKDVLKELNEEPDAENVAKTMRLLDKHGIEGHAFNDYPKWVQNERGERAVVHNEDHEQEFMSRPERVDEKGIPNPEHGHVDPATGYFVSGVSNRNYSYGLSGIGAPPYEPGAVDVIEPGGKKGPIASPVSDNRQNIQQNIDPMRGQTSGSDQLVTKARYGEVITERSGDHGNSVQPLAGRYDAAGNPVNEQADPKRPNEPNREPQPIDEAIA